MTSPADFSSYLLHATALMRDRMFDPKNMAKPSIHEKSFETVNTRLDRQVSKLRIAIGDDDLEGAWSAAADVANYAWMLVVKLEDKRAEEAERR